MIYCIIASDRETHNEWVMPKTFNTAVEAVEQLEIYEKSDPRFDYRMDFIKPTTRQEDFQLTELFGWYDGVKASERLINCNECGAVVSYDNKFMNIHQAWHNKLLP